MELFVDIVSGALILIGCLFLLSGSIGLIRMPDLYTRIHAASVTDTGGATFIILGLLVQDIFVFEDIMVAIKLLLVLLFICFTAPTASHALAKMALLEHIIPKCRNGRSVVEKSLYKRGKPADALDDDSAEDDMGANIVANKNTENNKEKSKL
jgi:multicomponent Na+:H+ antiporter subunit G